MCHGWSTRQRGLTTARRASGRPSPFAAGFAPMLPGGRSMQARDSRVQPPALDAVTDVPLFNTIAVVHQTGVPAPTLRAWERRYGILAPRRGENDYRLYSER